MVAHHFSPSALTTMRGKGPLVKAHTRMLPQQEDSEGSNVAASSACPEPRFKSKNECRIRVERIRRRGKQSAPHFQAEAVLQARAGFARPTRTRLALKTKLRDKPTI